MIKTRFAPSPTGYLHIGGLRTALYAYALARHEGGEFLLRIEDTDQKRTVPGAKEKIIEILKEFNLTWDGEPVIQSERAKAGVYREAALNLLAEGHAFYCDCESRNAKTEGYSAELRDPCRDKKLTKGAIKLRVPEREKITFHDFILDKDIVWDSEQVKDTVLLKSDGYLATYHLAYIVDDHASGITHVIRSSEWLTSTPIHILVYKYLGYKMPEIGHPTAILDPEGGKLSKRKGNVSVEEFVKEGYLPQAILNFIMLLGWAPKDNRELFTLAEFVEFFDIAGFQKSNPIFNKEKLDWFNGEYIRNLSDSDLCKKLGEWNKKFKELGKEKKLAITKLIKDRIKKLSDFDTLARFFFERIDVDLKLLGKGYVKHLSVAKEVLSNIKDWTKENIDNDLMNAITGQGFKTGDFFMDLRVAITGARFTPPINDSILILGKDETLQRLKRVI